MSIEFFVEECNRPVDSEGYELPEWENPYFAIPDQGEPTEADHAWLAANPILPPIAGGSPEPYIPTAQDWADYEAFCREVDQRHEQARMEDAEYEARCRFG